MWIRLEHGEWVNLDYVDAVKQSGDEVTLYCSDGESVVCEASSLADLIHYLMTEAIDCRKPEDRS